MNRANWSDKKTIIGETIQMSTLRSLSFRCFHLLGISMGSLPENTEGSQNWLKLIGFVELFSLIIFVSRKFSFGSKIEPQGLKYWRHPLQFFCENFFRHFSSFCILTIFWFHIAPSEISISDSDSPLKTASCPIFMKKKFWFPMCPCSHHSWPLFQTSCEKKRSHFGIWQLSGI